MSPQMEQDHLHWLANLVFSRQHKYCAKLCVNFTSGKGIDDVEKECMSNCFAKYNTALDAFADERAFFHATLDDLEAQGKDVYSSRHL